MLHKPAIMPWPAQSKIHPLPLNPSLSAFCGLVKYKCCGERSIGYEGVKHFHPESLKYMRLDDVDMDNIDYNALYEWSGLRPARPKGYS